jgi:hypothetical protein
MALELRPTLAALFSSAIVLAGCATYGGPQLTTVMSTTCANQSLFSRFRDCVNSSWYSAIAAAGYGNDPNVQFFNARMQLLSRAVSERRMSDSEAILNATDFAFQLRAAEQTEIARQNDALLRALSQAAAQTPSGTAAGNTGRSQAVVACTKIGDSSRQVFNFYGVACPVGYAPTL